MASFDHVARRLADVSGVAVLVVEYRLAPEHAWPASVEDTVTALRWVAGSPAELGAPPTSVAVAGDSAGGTLAALACHRLRGENGAPDLQVLLYANTDLTGGHPSMTEKATGFALDAETVRFFSRQWVPDERRWGDPRVSPLHAPDIAGLPPAVVVTAEHDPLRDEGEAYGERLRAAGVPVTVRREAGVIHNFLQLADASPAAAGATDRVASDLATHLATGASPT